MKRKILWATLVALLLAGPAYADWCLQLDNDSGGEFGFFRFTGTMPKVPGRIVSLTARANGYSPAFGAATVYKDGSAVEVGVTYFSDAVQGQFNVYLQSPRFIRGFGYASYGEYGVNNSVTAKVVGCLNEPGQ